jgi:hypothetical protein
LTFTSFGDRGTSTLGKKYAPPAGVTITHPPYVNDNLGSPAAGDTALGVERLRPMFHLFNGDLCYANLAEDRVHTWWDFWANNSRSARNRPWMPSPGNHENGLGNGPIGYRAYQTYFLVPAAAGQTDVTRFGMPSQPVRCASSALRMTTSRVNGVLRDHGRRIRPSRAAPHLDRMVPRAT